IALKIARRGSVVMAVQFAVGAVTGTILSFEFGILWPRMMGRFGAAFGLGFAIEGLAFFMEAIFISIYLYGWKRLSPRAHFLTGLALPPAGLLGAFGVLAANSWMNTPGGVTIDAGRLVSVDAMAALFTPALTYEFWHFLLAIYITAGFVIASVYAAEHRREQHHPSRVRPDGRARERRRRTFGVVPVDPCTPAQAARQRLVLQAGRARRHRVVPGSRVRMGDHRGRAAAVDRLRRHARLRRRDRRARRVRVDDALGPRRRVCADRVLLHHAAAEARGEVAARGRDRDARAGDSRPLRTAVMTASLPNVVALVLLLGITAYRTAGGVDFGAGIRHL